MPVIFGMCGVGDGGSARRSAHPWKHTLSEGQAGSGQRRKMSVANKITQIGVSAIPRFTLANFPCFALWMACSDWSIHKRA